VLIKKLLGGTPFHRFFFTQVPFKISKKALSEHCIIVAKPGHGKTQLLSSFASQFLNDPSKPGLFCLDPAGDWFEILRDRVPPERLVVLDPETDPPPLNFFDFKNSTEAAALQSFMYLMSSLSGGMSDKQSAIVPYLLKLLRKIESASLETLRLIVDEKVKDARKSEFWSAIETLPLVDQGFFHNQWYHSIMEPTKQAIAWKIYAAMSSDAFKQMFTAPTNSFDAHAAMRDRKVVLVRGSELTLGEHGLSVFLQYVVSQFFLASLARFRIPANQRHQCYLLCDEASHIFNHQTSRILTECRKLGLSFFGATQVIDQIPTEVKASIYGATSVKVAGNVSSSDANILAREMRTSGEFIQNMKTFEWAFFVADSDKAMKVRVPPGALEAMQKQQVIYEKQRGDTEVSPSQPAELASEIWTGG
jgi:Helicase HerA, central domain